MCSSDLKNIERNLNIVAIVLFLNRIIFFITVSINGGYNIKYDLPLHFCFIAAYIFIFAVLTKNIWLYRLSYYFAITGPLVAIIMPNTTQNTGIQLGSDRYIYYQFLIAHHILILANLYILWVAKYDIRYKDGVFSFIVGNVILVLVNIFNYYVGSNYSMLKTMPKEVVDVMPILGVGPPIVWLEIGAVLMLLIGFIPIKLEKRKAANH